MIASLLFAYLAALLKATAYLFIIACGYHGPIPAPPHRAMRLAPACLLLAAVLVEWPR